MAFEWYVHLLWVTFGRNETVIAKALYFTADNVKCTTWSLVCDITHANLLSKHMENSQLCTQHIHTAPLKWAIKKSQIKGVWHSSHSWVFVPQEMGWTLTNETSTMPL